MITIKNIEQTIDDAKKMNFDVSVRDISYVILFLEYNSSVVAYRSIYNKDAIDDEIVRYDKSERIDFLKSYVKTNFKKTDKVDADKILADITFEENKDALISMLQEIQQGMIDGRIEYKDGLKMQADIRFKLKDKFEIEKKEAMQYVIVEKKYNAVCEHCRHEIYIPTKEDLMEEYDLIEKPK